MHLAILGAGPIGIESALAASQMGHTTTILERGRVAQSVLQWGHVSMFTPWQMNTTKRGRAVLGIVDNEGPACPTGAEFAHEYLRPLARDLDVQTETIVRGVSKRGLRKGQLLGSPERLKRPFELLVSRGKREDMLFFDAVLDCTGVFGQPNPTGLSGLPVPGEQAAVDSGFLRFGPSRNRVPSGGEVLLIGDGASAVTTLSMLLDEDRASYVHWLTPSAQAPGFVSPPDDPLPSRKLLFERGFEAVHHPKVRHLPSVSIQRFEPRENGLRAALTNGDTLNVQAVIACTGYHPDHTILRELQAHWCWGTDGPMKLSASLLSNTSGDCLQAPASGPDTLRHPEPGLFVLGAKSYGRRSDFLLSQGHQQIEHVLGLLGEGI